MLAVILAMSAARADVELVGAPGAVAVRMGSGWYALRPALDTAARLAGERWDVGLSVQGAFPARDAASGWAHTRDWMRADLTIGVRGGQHQTRVRFELGPSVTVLRTRWTEPEQLSAVVARPGVRYGAGVVVPMRGRAFLDAAVGASARGRSHDVDLAVGVGVAF